MGVTLNIGIDLGSDCLKIAYAYQDKGKLYYGKIEKESLGLSVAMSAVAMYNAAENCWLFGDQVDSCAENSFITVVKIKSLLSLLLRQNDESIKKANRNYYFNEHYFPKFYFPVRRKIKTDFAAMVEEDAVFVDNDSTPQDVCRDFFRYAAEMVWERIAKLSAYSGISFNKQLNIALVHPSRAGSAYIDELASLIQEAFGVAPCKMLSSTKALSMFAYQRGMIVQEDNLLMFDMGEEDISVEKAMLLDGGKLSVDGADGHSEPLEVGGNDVDDEIAAYIETGISRRETMGTPSYGSEGHIAERGLHSKQYLFHKSIKKAKRILSLPLKKDSVFKNGVPVSVCRDVYIQRMLTKEEFSSCVGVTGDNGTARKIADYILTEISRSVNSDVNKIFISGGFLETYGLLDYIKEKIRAKYKSMQIYTFDDYKTHNDGFNILSYEDSLYAPAVGGAIVALKNYDVQTVVSLSYATWVMKKDLYTLNDKKRILKIFINKGEVLPKESVFHYLSFDACDDNVSFKEIIDEIYSTIVSQEDIERGRYSEKLLQGQYVRLNPLSGEYSLLVDSNKNSATRHKLEKVIALKTVGGENGAKIHLFYNNRRIYLYCKQRVKLAEGFIVDEEGHARPYIMNAETMVLNDTGKIAESRLGEIKEKRKKEGNRLIREQQRSNASTIDFVKVIYKDTGMTGVVPKCLIEPRFIDMEQSITLQGAE